MAGELIHHDPDGEEEGDDDDEDIDCGGAGGAKRLRTGADGSGITTKQLRVTRTVAAYRTRFGHAPPADIWRFSTQPAEIPPLLSSSFSTTTAAATTTTNNNNADSEGYAETMDMGTFGQHSEELEEQGEEKAAAAPNASALDLSEHGIYPSQARDGWELRGTLAQKCVGQVHTTSDLTLEDYNIKPDATLQLVLRMPDK